MGWCSLSDDFSAHSDVYRLTSIERRLEKFENLEPAVMKQEIADIKSELRNISEEISSMRRMLLGFIATFALSSVTVIVSITTLMVGR